MNLFDRIRERLFLFFHVDLYLYYHSLSLFKKIMLITFVLTLLAVVGIILFVFVMVFIFSNFSRPLLTHHHELLYPVEEITSVEILYIEDSIDLYRTTDLTPSIVDGRTIKIAQLTPTQIPTCADMLCQLDARTWFAAPSCDLSGGVIHIIYENGSQEWLSAPGSFYFDSTKNETALSRYHFDDEQFNNLLTQYGYTAP